MKENRNIPGQKLSDRLPVHSPDESLWSSISAGLDSMESQQYYEQRMQDLPVHKPNESAWIAIAGKMNRARLVKIGGYSLLAAAASLLLLISIIRFPDTRLNESNNLTAIGKPSEGQVKVPEVANASIPAATTKQSDKSKSLSSDGSDNNVNSNQSVIPLLSNSAVDEGVSIAINSISPAKITLANNIPSGKSKDIQLINARTGLKSAAVMTDLQRKPAVRKSIPTPALAMQEITKYYSPDPYNPNKKKGNSFELAANYLPETLENGYGTSMFHNVGLMASLGNEKTRVQSSIGMTYNSEHRTFGVDYTQHIPITNPSPGGPADSIIIMAAEGSSRLDGTEKHQYITYDLGVGRKLFSLGKMSTWVNTGAGFAVKLDQSSLKETTINTIKNHNNATVDDIDIEIPDYNKVNINIMAGLDFNYSVMNRLIISFAPTSRIYLKSVLEKEGSSTDSFSLGFRSGLKFKF